MSQDVINTFDPLEKPGSRPYEMVWACRKEPFPPTLSFHQLEGWKITTEGGAKAVFQVSRAQNLWNRPVGKLRYWGKGRPDSKPRILLWPPQPIPIPQGADVVEMWVYGNRWDWENPLDTPAVQIGIHLRDHRQRIYPLRVDTVRWKEWWLLHRRLPQGMEFPVYLECIEVAGGYQPEEREIFFDSIYFYQEDLPPLFFSPRPKRNLTLFEGQSPGANLGPGTLPFPTREETILPINLSKSYHNERIPKGENLFEFKYSGKDCTILYQFDATKGLAGITAFIEGKLVGTPMAGAEVRLAGRENSAPLQTSYLEEDTVVARYEDGTLLRLRIWQKSLVIDIINRSGQATELTLGRFFGVQDPRTIWVPYITFGSSNPCVLLCRAGRKFLFASLWLDWYRSNGSELYGAEETRPSTARINGGVRYYPRTDGKRNPLYERLFLTLSPRFEEVLPTIPNPVGLHAREAVDRLWQESWGPDNYAKQKERSRKLRAYGIEKLIQCNHEITWRDGGESFTLRLHAAPGKGGDEALQDYVQHQKSLGWLSGLYTNYCDFAPVNGFWDPQAVQRTSEGEWRSAWPRCWALKPLRAVEFEAQLAPQIKERYKPNSAYTDVHTAVAPWHYNDYDARVPGAGTFAQTFYAYGELLRNDSAVYQGPIFSEGTYQWMYAGLADGNYALAYNGRPLAKEPLLPVFDLYQIHTKECDIGMGWTSFFCDAIPDWRHPQNIDRAIDRFLLHTLAYGHIGWLVEEEFGIERTCRSYYMLQQVQARYGLKAPKRIAYWDGQRLLEVSQALIRDLPRTRRQIYIEYPNGLQMWLNDHSAENWQVRIGSKRILLPPAGWAVYCRGSRKAEEVDSSPLLSFSALQEGRKVDYLRSEAYTYQDGRGAWFATPEAGSSGALALFPEKANQLRIIHISGKGPFLIRRPYGVRGSLQRCEAFDAEGKPLPPPQVTDNGKETWIKPVEGAVQYLLLFSGKLKTPK